MIIFQIWCRLCQARASGRPRIEGERANRTKTRLADEAPGPVSKWLRQQLRMVGRERKHATAGPNLLWSREQSDANSSLDNGDPWLEVKARKAKIQEQQSS